MHELGRWLKSGYFWYFFIFLLVVVGTSVYGSLETEILKIRTGVSSAPGLTELLLSTAQTGVLCTAALGIVVLGRDFESKLTNRLFMFGNQLQVFIVKILVVVVLSAIIGVVCLGGIWIFVQTMLQNTEYGFISQYSLLEWGGRYFLVYVTASILGVIFAMLFRNTIIALCAYFIYNLLVEAFLLSSFPKLGKYFPGGAQAAIIQDINFPERLSTLPGVGVYILWLLVMFWIASLVCRRFTESPEWFKLTKKES